MTVLSTGGGRGRSYQILADAAAKLTPAGRYYYEQTGQQPPRRMFDDNQEPITRGANTYIRGRDNREMLVRSQRPDGSTRITAVGRQYFRNRHSEYIVHIPVIIRGKRRNGNFYQRRTSNGGDGEPVMLPVSMLGVGQLLENSGYTPEQAAARVRSRVLQELQLRTEGGLQVLMEVSGETTFYDRDAGSDAWKISALRTTVDAAGRADTEAVIRAPMAGLRSAASHLPHPELILPECFEEHPDKLCVARGLAALLKRTPHSVADDFDAVLGGPEWRQVGVTAEDLKAFAVCFGHPFFFCAAGRLLLYYEPSEKKGRAIACYYYDGHAYIYENARALSQWKAGEATSDRVVLQHEARGELPPFEEWKLYQKPEPGLFHVDDLAFLRAQLLSSGRSPKVGLRDEVTIGSLTYHCNLAKDGCVGVCRVREYPPYAQEIQTWLSALPREITYRGQRLPAITNEVLLQLLKAERRTPGPEERAQLLKAYDNRCSQCGGIFDGDLEWDHAQPLRQTVRGAPQKFQPICASCHLEKTQMESRQDRTLESCFSKHAWEAYVQSPRPPPLAWRPNEPDEAGELFELDVRRCRRNALAHSAHPFSIFCPLDRIQEAVPGELGDFNFIALPGRRSKDRAIPYVGPGWYHRVAAEFLLHHMRCTWSDIKWTFTSLAHVPPECLEQPLKAMEQAWAEETGLAKLSVNQMIGLWAKDRTTVYSARTSSNPLDAPGYLMKREVQFGDDQQTFDFVYATKALTLHSMRPVHDQVMHTEYVRVAQLLFVIQKLKVPARCVVSVKTDAVILQGFSAHRKKHLMAIANTTFSDLPHLRRKFEKPREKGQTQLVVPMEMAGRKGDEEPVFRYSTEASVLQGIYKEPAICAQEPVPVPPWKDLTEEEAIEAAGSEGLLVLGAPGTGKTFWARGLVQRLREAGKRVDVIAKTHASVQNFGVDAQTADHYVRRYIRAGSCSADYLVVEEISQINSSLWCDIALAHHKGIRIIALGDFGQFGPICDSYAGAAVPRDALERSDMLRQMVCSNRFRLTENKRSDEAIFNFVTSLRPGEEDERDYSEALAEARQLFPATSQPADWTLTMSHRRRVAINAARNRALKPQCAVFFEHKRQDKAVANEPQSMYVWPGLVLIGAGGKCTKGILTSVVACSEQEVELSTGAKLQPQQLIRSTRLAHALTYASCQGLTLPGRVRLETDSPNMTLRHLYVGASRATAAGLLEVV